LERVNYHGKIQFGDEGSTKFLVGIIFLGANNTFTSVWTM